MSGVRFEYKAEFEEWHQFFHRLERWDTDAVLSAIGSYGVSSTQARFETGTDPDGVAWPESLRAKVSGGVTLTEHGHLRDSMTYNVSGADSVEWGTDVIYGRIHQMGGTIKAKDAGGLAFSLANGEFAVVQKVEMPERPFLGVNDDDAGEIRDIVLDELERQTLQ